VANLVNFDRNIQLQKYAQLSRWFPFKNLQNDHIKGLNLSLRIQGHATLTLIPNDPLKPPTRKISTPMAKPARF
jgi:hypothetical protein